MFEPSPNALVANRYRLIREIGRGGMGAVWEAFDLELEAPCALKFILNQNTKPPEVRARFLREARAVARLQSPHVVNIRSVGEWEGALYIAMELLAGETLFDRLTRVGRLSPRDTSRVVAQVASVLTMSHAAGIVHRDLKPENIWLWSHDDVFVKVLDFGVAKQVFEDNPLLKTATGTLVGTPYYMSPEQAAGDRHVDHRSDVWSLGIIAAECLSGKRPFQNPGLGQLLASIIAGPTPPLTELYEKTTPALSSWWSRATAKDPNARYDSAQALANGLSLALELGPLSGDAGREREGGSLSAPEVTGSDTPLREPHLATSSLSPLTAPPQPPTTTQIAVVPAELFRPPTNDESTAARVVGSAETQVTPPASIQTPSETRVSSRLPTYGAVAALALVAAVIWFVNFTPERNESEPDEAASTSGSPQANILPTSVAPSATTQVGAPEAPRASATDDRELTTDGVATRMSTASAAANTAHSAPNAPTVKPQPRASLAPPTVAARASTPPAQKDAVTTPRPTRPAATPKPNPPPAAPAVDKRVGF